MLQNLSEEIRRCYREAEECALQAKAAATEALRADHLRQEQSWSLLARSYELQQRLTLFVRENKRKRDEDRGIGYVIPGEPAARAERAILPPPSPTSADPKVFRNELITIVDDDDSARGGLSALIESRGNRAATFVSAEDYLASDVKENTGCLILDVHLLGMSGPDLQTHLLAVGCCPPTIFVTGRFEEHVRKRVLDAGALAYLSKPCAEKTLFDCIAKALGAKR